jgi:hypothetical protein
MHQKINGCFPVRKGEEEIIHSVHIYKSRQKSTFALNTLTQLCFPNHTKGWWDTCWGRFGRLQGMQLAGCKRGIISSGSYKRKPSGRIF